MSLDISLLLLVSFLLFTLVMFFCSLNKKVTNFREHAVGHRQFATAALAVTIVASYCPGGLLRAIITDASMGIWPIAHRIIIALFPLLTLSWLAGRMSKFMYNLSMPETMGNVYGRYARFITALFEVCNAVIIVSLQIRIITDAASLFITSVHPLTITILMTQWLLTLKVGYVYTGLQKTVCEWLVCSSYGPVIGQTEKQMKQAAIYLRR